MPASVHATATGITPAVLRGMLDPATLEDLAGTVDVALNVETPSTDLSRATGDLTLTRLDLQMAGLPVTQRVPTRFVSQRRFRRASSRGAGAARARRSACSGRCGSPIGRRPSSRMATSISGC